MVYEFTTGATPLLINVPHAGTQLPADLESRLTPSARRLPDTDWHVDRLVAGAPGLGASVLVARCSRFVIDLNRGPDDQPLYAGATTGLVPTETFAGEPVYAGPQPDEQDVARRIAGYWRPYHDRLAESLEALRARHGLAVLFDVHSIRSRVPRLFSDRLPDLNLGTFDQRSCDPGLRAAVSGMLAEAEGFSHVVDGRFKGGYITRHYGRPEAGVHALQLEIVQACYMDENNPETWHEARARALMALIDRLADFLATWRPS